ncbi:MAG: TerC family protein, partial [Steroidobacteraceae bacterium]
FSGIVVALLAFDLGVLNKDNHVIGLRESLLLSSGYIGIALLFGALVWWQLGAHNGTAYFTGFLIEKLLSIDNVYVIALIFTYLAIPSQYQHRVLFWGIVGALVMRAVMIGVGATLVSALSWILYLFGAFLVFTGVKMWFSGDHAPDIAKNPLLTFLRKRVRTTDLTGNAFIVRRPDPATGQPVRWVTPLFFALCLVEFVDIAFAVDSIPAIFAITTDPFIVYTSNIFAILGLRSLYFVLGSMVQRFKYLKYALALVLIFIGGKVLLGESVGKISPIVSLSVTLALIAGGVLVSIWKSRDALHATGRP